MSEGGNEDTAEDHGHMQERRSSLFNFTIHSQSNKYKSLATIDDKEKAIELMNEQGVATTCEQTENFFKVHNLCGEDIFEETDYDYCIVSRSAEAIYRGNINLSKSSISYPSMRIIFMST